MKRWLILLILMIVTIFLSPVLVAAQSNVESNNHTAREEAEGKEIWEKLQAKQLECKNLTDDNFEVLGEYFMGQSIGNTERHAAMNQMMRGMMGEEDEEQMHVAMGKRLSGCEPNAQISSNGVGFMPMMWMMGSTGPSATSSGPSGSPQVGGGGNPMMGSGWNNMMGGWGGFGVLGWLSMLIFWILLVLGVIALIRYLARSGQDKERRTPLDILKERYAKGEIDKKEFEEKKKDLV